MWLKLSFLVFLGALLWPQYLVSAQLEIFDMLNMTLTASNPNVDYSSPDVMSNNLEKLATLMGNVTKTYALRVNLKPDKPPRYYKERMLVIGLAYWVVILNPLADQIVTIINNTRYDVTEPPPAVSLLERLLIAFWIQDPANVTLTPVTYAPGTSATSPDIFGAEMNRTAQLSVAIIEYLFTLSIVELYSRGSPTFFYGFQASVYTVQPFNDILLQIAENLKQKLTPPDPSSVLSTLGKLSSEFQLIGNFISSNTSLTPSDPIQTYTCGAVFTENLNRFFVLLNKTAVAGSMLINSNTTAVVTISSNVTQTVGEFNSILPFLANLTQQVAGILLNGMDMSGTSRRRVYPHQVRTNMDRADCHKLYLKRYNARRLG